MSVRTKTIAALLLTALVSAFIAVPAQAVGPLQSDAHYAALVNYVNWLQQRKSQKANASQKDGFRNTLSLQAQGAFQAVADRSTQRVNEDYAANRGTLAAGQQGLTAQYQTDIANIDKGYQADIAGYTSDYNSSVSDLQDQLNSDLADAKTNYQDQLSNVNDSWGSQINPAMKAYNKSKHKYGAKSKKTRKAQTQLNNQLKGKAHDVQAAQNDYNSSVATLQATFTSDKKKLTDQYNAEVAQAQADQKTDEDATTAQYQQDMAQAQADADAAWGQTYAQDVAVFNAEHTAVGNQRDQGFGFISAMSS